MIRFSIGIVAAALTTGIGAAGQTPSSSSLSATVDSIANAVLSSTGVPSATVAVVRHGKLEYANAYGSARLEPKQAATPELRYALGSISKQFTAAAILLLQQDGKLKLDDPVSKFVPGLTRGNEVTIRNVLSHTSGYQDFWPQDYVMPMMLKPVTPATIVNDWAKKPLDFEPGSRWQYSNTNYTIAGMIIEKASGRPPFAYIKSRILEPLGIKAEDFDANPRAATAIGYLRYALGPLRPAPDAASGWMWAAGELAMTASDLAKWDISMIKRSLLRPAGYRDLEKNVLLNNGAGTDYGLGVSVYMNRGHFMVEHDGEVSGFTAENMVYPEDSVAVVVLTNQDAAPAASTIAEEIVRKIFRSQDSANANRTAQIREIFEGLQHGKIDRSLFTPNANAYFSETALQDFASSLGPLGVLAEFEQTRKEDRGGMVMRSYRATFPSRTVRVWTYELPNGKLEQLQVAPEE